MPEPMKFAVIGCGMLARQQHLPNLARSAKASVHTCCDLSADVARHCQEEFGGLKATTDYREAINEPEVEAVILRINSPGGTTVGASSLPSRCAIRWFSRTRAPLSSNTA